MAGRARALAAAALLAAAAAAGAALLSSAAGGALVAGAGGRAAAAPASFCIVLLFFGLVLTRVSAPQFVFSDAIARPAILSRTTRVLQFLHAELAFCVAAGCNIGQSRFRQGRAA